MKELEMFQVLMKFPLIKKQAFKRNKMSLKRKGE